VQKIIKAAAMKKLTITICLSICLPTVLLCIRGNAQDTTVTKAITEPVTKPASKPVKNTFESNWVIDNQSVMVPKKGTFEFDIQHRFGTVNNGYSDFYGLFAPSNIRLGFSYVVKDRVQVGFGFCKELLQWDLNVKYAIFKQMTSGGSPVSVTFFGNGVIETGKNDLYVTFTDRMSYFSQLIVARKVNDKFSVQGSVSLSYYNNVPGYIDSKNEIQPLMNNAHFAVAVQGRYKLTDKLAFLVNYDQPLTEHPSNNPHPNISFGFEATTSSHAFQLFAGNYNSIIPQRNNMFNQNDYTEGQFCIGFNITRLWNF
jgi:hypothetical protein